MEKRFCKLSRFVLHMGFNLSIVMTIYALFVQIIEKDILKLELLQVMLVKYLELPVVVAAECIICAVLIEFYHKKQK